MFQTCILLFQDGYSTAEGAKASVMCIQGYQLNLPGKERTAAYCTCDGGLCSWKFNKKSFISYLFIPVLYVI